MVALHATDPVTVYLSVRARVPAATVEAVDEALYASRAIVRMLGMRRTMSSCRPRFCRWCSGPAPTTSPSGCDGNWNGTSTKGGVGGRDAAGWLRDLEDAALRALAARGSATGAQLCADESRLRTQLVYVPDKSYGGAANIAGRGCSG